MIHILKLIATVSQAIMPLVSFELLGFAAFMLAMIQNTLIGIDAHPAPDSQETLQN